MKASEQINMFMRDKYFLKDAYQCHKFAINNFIVKLFFFKHESGTVLWIILNDVNVDVYIFKLLQYLELYYFHLIIIMISACFELYKSSIQLLS